MSILIKGMEMPKDGEMLCINIYPDGKVCTALDLDCKQIATAFVYGKIANRQKPKKNCRKNGACACKNGIGECSTAGWVSERCRYYRPKAEEGET